MYTRLTIITATTTTTSTATTTNNNNKKYILLCANTTTIKAITHSKEIHDKLQMKQTEKKIRTNDVSQ
jgi:hypothetical protein